MNIFTQIAQVVTTETTTTTLTTGEAAAVGAVVMTILAVGFIFAAISYIISSLCLMSIFKKAGVPGWMAWVPFVNNWKTLEIGGQPGFWAILAIIPIVNIVSAVMLYIAMYHIGLKLGKSGAFVVLAIFLPIVWLIWLALDKTPWNDEASDAPSLHQGAPVAQPTYAQPAPVAHPENTTPPTPPTL